MDSSLQLAQVVSCRPASKSTGATGMAATGMAHGTLVQLHGLKSKPELNGQYSVILEAQNATEVAELERVAG